LPLELAHLLQHYYSSYWIDQRLILLDSDKKDLPELSRLGHFLKGSAAAIGVIKVRDICEKMQHWGHSKDETGSHPIPDDKASDFIKDAIIEARKGYDEAEIALRKVLDSCIC